jgi:hypothetical protein
MQQRDEVEWHTIVLLKLSLEQDAHKVLPEAQGMPSNIHQVFMKMDQSLTAEI